MVEYKDMTPEEQRRYRQNQPGWEDWVSHPPTGDKPASWTDLKGKKKPPKPAPAPAPAPAPKERSLGSRLLGGAREFMAGFQQPPGRGGGSRAKRAGRAVSGWRQNMAANVNRMTMDDFLPSMGGGFAGPAEPAPRRRSGKRRRKSRGSREPASRPWDPGHIPDSLRDFF